MRGNEVWGKFCLHLIISCMHMPLIKTVYLYLIFFFFLYCNQAISKWYNVRFIKFIIVWCIIVSYVIHIWYMHSNRSTVSNYISNTFQILQVLQHLIEDLWLITDCRLKEGVGELGVDFVSLCQSHPLPYSPNTPPPHHPSTEAVFELTNWSWFE